MSIQCWWRQTRSKRLVGKLRAEKQRRIEEQKQLRAAVKIQKCFRYRLERRQYAAAIIKQWWRSRVAIRKAKKHLGQLKQEKELENEKKRREAAAVMIQMKVLSWLTTRRIMKRRKAAVTLQCWWRRCCAEQELIKLIKEKQVRQMHIAATKIQVSAL